MAVHRLATRRLFAVAAAASMLTGLLPFAGASTAAAAPAAPILSTPASGDTVAGNPVFGWSAVATAAKYRIQVSASDTFATFVVNEETPSLRYTPIGELPLGLLYWRVASVDVAGLPGAYATDTFTKVWNAAPNPTAPTAAAVLSFPDDPLLFTWEPLAGAQSYELQVDDDAAFIGATTLQTKNTSYVITEPKTSGQSFYWRVRAASGGLYSDWSQVTEFSVAWPSVPTLVYPAQNQQLTDVYFAWDPVPGASTYQIQVSPNGDWANNRTVDLVVKGTRYAPPSELNNGGYFWRVRARDAATTPNNGGWSAERQFQRSWTPRPVLLGPANGDYMNADLTFSWTPVANAAYYELEYSTDPNFLPPVSYSCYTNHTRLTPYTKLVGAGEPGGCEWRIYPGATYYWHVRGIDPPVLNPGASEPGVLGLWSNSSDLDIWSFSFVPDIPALVAPAPGAAVDVPTLRWDDALGASRYQVTILKANGTSAASGTTYATSWTPPIALTPLDGPFRWYVQSYDYNGNISVVPSSLTWRTFSLNLVVPTAPAPEQVAPADLAASVDMPSLEWQPMVGADHYEVWYSTSGVTYFRLGTSTRNAAYTHMTDSLAAGTYYWYVRAFNNAGGEIGASSTARRFVINAPPLIAPDDYLAPDRCPPNTVCAAEADTPTLSWTAVPSALTYWVYVAQDPDFTNIYRTYATSFTELTPRESFVDNQAGQAFYWFVRPLRDDNTGRFDSQAQQNESAFQKRSEGIHRTAPAEAASVPNQVTFEWDDFLATNQGLTPPVTQEAKQYRIQVSTVADFATVMDDRTVDQPFYTPYAATYPEGPLFWRVEAIDGSANGLTYSTSGSLTKSSPPVTLAYPADGSMVQGVPYLQWNPQAFAASYDIQFDNDANFSSPIALVNTKMTAWTYPEALAAGDYFWRARRKDADGRVGPWSLTRAFTLQPAAPTLLSPANGGNPSPLTLLLQWTNNPPSAKYAVDLSTNASFTTHVAGFPTTTVMTSYAPKTLLANGTYFWRVTAKNAAGVDLLPPSSTWSFTVDSSRPSVTALSPSSSAAITTAFTVTFSEPVTGVDDTSFVVVPSGGTALAGAVTVLSPTSARFTPAAILVPGQTYVIGLGTPIADLVGNPLLPYSSNVRTSTTVQQDSPAAKEAWGRWSTGSASGGAMKLARTAYSTLTFAFDGTDVALTGFRGTSGGYASVYLDGVLQSSSVSFYYRSSQYRRTVWSKTGLAAGPHTLRIMARGTKPAGAKDTWVYVDGIVVNGVTIQESAPTVTERFRTVSTASASGSSYEIASHVLATGRSGASFSFQFRGTGISWYATKGASYGKAAVYIDGVKRATIDLYRTGTAYRQKVFSSATLSNGLHTIKVVVLGQRRTGAKGYNVSFDYFAIK